MEVCYISDNQRLKSHQMPPKITQDLIKVIFLFNFFTLKKCAVPPTVLYQQNSNLKSALNIDNNEYLSAANLRTISTNLSLVNLFF